MGHNGLGHHLKIIGNKKIQEDGCLMTLHFLMMQIDNAFN
jgi:hypothetical protein